MIYNPFYYFTPFVPDEKYQRPPLLYDIMNAIVNFDAETPTKISNLSSVARETIFDFNYPLSSKVDKEEFETLILDRFIMRRLGYQTYTAWKIALKVKLNEIMPHYNKIFDSFTDWNIFVDGETGERHTTNNLTKENSVNKENSGTRETSSNSEIDNRYSKLPQNEINNVKDGSYMTDYTLNQNTNESNDNIENTENTNENGEENSIYNETYRKNNPNKIDSYLKFIENKNKTMSLIFADLDSLFYGLAN